MSQRTCDTSAPRKSLPIDTVNSISIIGDVDHGHFDIGSVDLGDWQLVKRDDLNALMTELYELRGKKTK